MSYSGDGVVNALVVGNGLGIGRSVGGGCRCSLAWRPRSPGGSGANYTVRGVPTASQGARRYAGPTDVPMRTIVLTAIHSRLSRRAGV